MMGQLYIKHLPAEVRAGRVPEAAVDEAVRRVLRTKIRLGLFDRPDIDPTRVDAIFPTAESRQVAREVARETLVLLQNRGDVLPIEPGTRSIAVIGPLADAPRDQFGPHGARGHAEDSVSVLTGHPRTRQWSPESRSDMPPVAISCAANTDQLPPPSTRARNPISWSRFSASRRSFPARPPRGPV